MCNLSRRSPCPCLVAGDNPARGRGLYAYGLIRVIHDLLICCATGEGEAGQGRAGCIVCPVDYGPNNLGAPKTKLDGLLIRAFLIQSNDCLCFN